MIFFEQVYDIVAVIPSGKVVSYGQIARALGSPRSARMVGWAMARCPEGLPWHRVIKTTALFQEASWPIFAGSSWKQKVFAFFLTAEWTWKSAGGQSGKPRLKRSLKGFMITLVGQISNPAEVP